MPSRPYDGRYTLHRFVLPELPKPDYDALKKLCQLLNATQLEVVCVGLRLLAGAAKWTVEGGEAANLKRLRAMLADFRNTAPSDTAPLL